MMNVTLKYLILIEGPEVRIDIQKGQILVRIYVKIWSEKSQNFNQFSSKSIVGALNTNAKAPEKLLPVVKCFVLDEWNNSWIDIVTKN